jgi:hypothetical protein
LAGGLIFLGPGTSSAPAALLTKHS